MAQSGQTTVRWHLTSSDTTGRFVRTEWWIQPGGGETREHVQLHAEERFEVLSGRLTAVLGQRVIEAGPGERLVIPAGVPHRWWNAEETVLHCVVEIEPPGDFALTNPSATREERIS